MKTLKELLEARQLKSARVTELVNARETESRRFTADEAKEFGELNDELDELDEDIQVARFHARNIEGARPVDGSSAEGASRTRGAGNDGGGNEGGSRRKSSNIIVRNADPDDKFEGQSFVRVVIAKAAARLLDVSAVTIAEQRWGKSHPALVRYIRAAVAGGGSGSGEWGSELALADTRYTGEFVEFLYGMTLYDKLPLKEVPDNIHIRGQDGGGTGYWVGESKAIPATALDFLDVELRALEAAALCVVSNKLLQRADGSAEQMIRDALAEASSKRVDLTFLSANAAVAGVSPAGILNGVAPIASSGTDAQAVRDDILALYAGFITNLNASGLALVTTPSLAKATSLMTNALGQAEFPGVNGQGGTLLGDTLYAGDNVPASALILLKPRDIWRIGNTGVRVSMSRDAMIEQDTAPTGATDTPVAASATLTSMFQAESTAFKVVRDISFAKRRASAVAWINNANYGATGS